MIQDKEKPKIIYKPTEEEEDVFNKVWSKFSSAKQIRQQTYRCLNDRSVDDYVNDSMDRWHGYIEPRTDPAADWGAKVFTNMTRNKTIAIVAQVTAERLKGEFFAQNPNDPSDERAAAICKVLDDNAAYVNKDVDQQFYTALEAACKGTIVGFETYKRDKVKKRQITSYDPDTGEIDFEEKEIVEWDDVYSTLIPLLDIYVGNIYEIDIQKQPYIFWRSILYKSSFDTEFGNYDNAKYVQPGGDLLQDDKFKDYISADVESEDYEVLRYFNRREDQLVIICNGVVLTDIPFPWNHKKYPFWSTIFEPIATDFFYGKSLPDKTKSDQDVLNTLYRMMLDQTYLSIHKPIFTTSVQGIKDTYLYPGAKVIVDDLNQAREFNISGPEPTTFNMLKLVQDSIKDTTIDDPSQGVSGSSSTAFEVSVATEGAKKLLSLFLRSLESGITQKLELRLKNMFQFYQIPQVKGLTTEEESGQYSELRTITIQNATLADGSTGTQVLKIVPGQEQLPSETALNVKETNNLKQGKNVAWSYITAEWLNNLDVRVHIIPNSSIKMSEALRRALEVDYQAKVSQIYPDLLNRTEGFREFNLVYGKDPNKMMQKMPQQPGQPGAPQGATPPGGVQPNARAAPVAGMAGGQGVQQPQPGVNEILNSPRGVVREGTKNA